LVAEEAPVDSSVPEPDPIEPQTPEPVDWLTATLARRWAQTGFVVAAVLIAAMLCYPVLTTVPRLDLRFPNHPSIGTLNALAWMEEGTIARPDGQGEITFDGDLAVINWFNENVDGTPVIAEASIGPYRGNGSRISIATGLPTILGWDRHERQQRYQTEINTRWAEVIKLYDTYSPEIKMQILRKYNVEYVIVGDVERYSYLGGEPWASSQGIDTFATMVGTDLEIAFQSGNTIVYRVLDPAS
jgi:uncharacterized membrane protein